MISDLANGITDTPFLISCYVSVPFLVLMKCKPGNDFFITLLKNINNHEFVNSATVKLLKLKRVIQT